MKYLSFTCSGGAWAEAIALPKVASKVQVFVERPFTLSFGL